MRYEDYFIPADQTIGHIGSIVNNLDPILQQQYSGFASITAVTVYELAIKEIFRDFANRKHKVFGHFTDSHFKRINGRIGLKDLNGEHIPRFGEKYLNKFQKLLEQEEIDYLRVNQQSIKSSYGNLVAWRHGFAHQNQLPNNATFNEVQRAYDCGKKVIEVLARSLHR